MKQESYRNFELDFEFYYSASKEAKSKFKQSYEAMIRELFDKGYEILETAYLEWTLPVSVLIRGPAERDADKDFAKAAKLSLPYKTPSRYGYYKVTKRNIRR